jgi:ABC-2 type transport system permease protein
MSDAALNWRAMWGRAYPRMIGVMREPSWILFDIFLPLLGIAAFVFYYRAMGAPEVFTGFVVLGGAMTAFWVNVLWGMAAQLYWEKETGNLHLFLMAPMSRMAVLAGMAVGGMFQTLLRALSTFFLGFVLFNVQIQMSEPLGLLAVFSVTLVALYGMGMLFSSLYLLYGRGAYHLSNLLQEPIYLVSGFYFPVKALGFWVAAGASIVPITLGLDAMRQLMFSGMEVAALLPWQTELLVLVGLAVLFLLMARHALRYMEYRGKKEGRLVMRWQ